MFSESIIGMPKGKTAKPKVVKKPWGSFEVLSKGKDCTIKLLTVKSGEELSLQYHKHRDEFWKIISGSAKVTVGNKTKRAKLRGEFFVPRKTKHQIKAGKTGVKVLEVSFGKFSENDIVRLKDKYKRDKRKKK
ncbi:unnamed protein product [marine sediment metagenome]|uniref:Mannose-6-phosphate isomerase type II C-terminal domain-containing protein n=1 Tax=marine sediment metagenome TaxID=412755 RepID=X0X0N7_9ZZZZ